MPLNPPPVDNAALPAWVRDELYPWTLQVETFAGNLAGRVNAVETWSDKATDRFLLLRAKLLAVVQRIRGTPPVRGRGAPNIYDEVETIRAAFGDMDVPDQEWD